MVFSERSRKERQINNECYGAEKPLLIIALQTEHNKMIYSKLAKDIREFFIKDYSEKAQELRLQAANPKARKAEVFTKQAETLEQIILELKAV